MLIPVVVFFLIMTSNKSNPVLSQPHDRVSTIVKTLNDLDLSFLGSMLFFNDFRIRHRIHDTI